MVEGLFSIDYAVRLVASVQYVCTVCVLYDSISDGKHDGTGPVLACSGFFPAVPCSFDRPYPVLGRCRLRSGKTVYGINGTDPELGQFWNSIGIVLE